MKNRILLIIELALVVLILSTTVSAFGVSSPHWEGYPLTLYPGQTDTVDLNLQNIGEESVTVTAELIEGTEIAQLDRAIYVVAVGTTDTNAKIQVSIPEDAVVGDTYHIIVEFKAGSEGGDGAIAVGTGTTTEFDVVVVEEEKEEGISTTTMMLVAIVIIIIIALAMFWKKPTKSKKKK